MSPFAPEYIDLCRQHPIKKVWEWGDYYFSADTAKGIDPQIDLLTSKGHHPTPEAEHGQLFVAWTWLPRLDQLLDLLEARGARDIHFLYIEASLGGNEKWLLRAAERHPLVGRGETREEAAYRLLLHVVAPGTVITSTASRGQA